MNVLKSCYSELNSLVRLLPNIDSNEKGLFRGIYLSKKMTKVQEIQWKEILGRKRMISDNPTFLFNLLLTCHRKNRSNILLINIDMKNTYKNTFQYEEYVCKNSLILHTCLSNIWIKRREVLCDEILIYLLSEFTLIECLTPRRQLFIQLSGTHETFYSLPYFITRKSEDKQRADLKLNKFNRRKRTIKFHLHATKQGQQAHLTDLHEMLIARNMIQYHVSQYERFDVHHPIERSFNGQMFVDAMFSSNFSKMFFCHRPKEELVRKVE